MHPLERAFLDDICENPDDDTPRLVYADWLEDEGRSARAEFIRVQIEIAQLDPYHLSCRGKKCPGCSLLKNRDRDLLHSMIECADRHGRRQHTYAMYAWMPPELWDYNAGGWIWNRGFVETVRCPLQSWLDHGRQIVQAHPVRRVEVTDRQPSAWSNVPAMWEREMQDVSSEEWSYLSGERSRLPGVIFDLLPGEDNGSHAFVLGKYTDKRFDSAELAMDALSSALLLFARKPLESPATPTLTY